MIHIATGLAVRDGRVLLVASRYPNHEQPLWNLPGGRQQPGELLGETVAREVFEETGLRVEVGELAYVSESYDGDVHVLNATFTVMLRQAQHDTARSSFDFAPLREAQCRSAQDDTSGSAHGDSGDQGDSGSARGDSGDHVVAVEWVALEELAERIVVNVVREPLLAYLRGALPGRYIGYHDAGVTIEWPDDSR